jgi:hypothetical protein
MALRPLKRSPLPNAGARPFNSARREPGSKKARTSFLKKRSKKLLQMTRRAFSPPRSQDQSFFCFFFVHKKEDLTSFQPATRRRLRSPT